MAERVVLPEDQEFFKLNEVCKVANVQPYMLRFWGTEFAQLDAAKSGTGQRLYTKDQVEVILEIRRLLFDEGLTIAGARKRIGTLQEQGSLPTPEIPSVTEIAEAAAAPAKPKKIAKKAAPRPAPETPKEAAEAEPVEAAEAAEAAAAVDKPADERVQPLLATLKDVRDEVAKIVADLKQKA